MHQSIGSTSQQRAALWFFRAKLMRCCWHIFELMGRFKGTFSTLYDDDSCQTRKEVRSRIWSLIEVWRMGGYSRLWPTIIAGRTFILFVTWAECACTVGTYSHNCPVLKYWEQNGNCRLGKFFKLIGDSLEMHFEKSNNMRQQCDHDSMGIQKKINRFLSIKILSVKNRGWRPNELVRLRFPATTDDGVLRNEPSSQILTYL